jgi:CubicO group peptidase (beta-lactamase class C family)
MRHLLAHQAGCRRSPRRRRGSSTTTARPWSGCWPPLSFAARAYVQPAATGHDLVLDRPVVWTLGFQVDDEDGHPEIGMGGGGGSSAWAEPTAGYGAAYLTRGLGGHDRGEEGWQAVRDSFEPPTA